MKIAISIPDSLFKEAQSLANSQKISRSRLFTLALKDFLKRQKNMAILTALNESYKDEATDEEIMVLHKMKKYYARKIKQ